MPRVSVVVPTYNRDDLLGRAGGSVLSQTLADLELLVVDDGSTDDTARVVDRYDDPRLRYVAHDRNRGGSAARNTGIDLAEGEYVAFLDSDDEWLPTKLERQVRCLESRSHEWVAAYCGVRVDRDERFPVREWLGRLLPTAGTKAHGREGGRELVPDILLQEFTTGGGASNLLVRQAAVEAVGGSGTLSAIRCTQFQTAPCERSTPNSARTEVVSLSEQPVAWSRTANALTGVAVRSRSQDSSKSAASTR